MKAFATVCLIFAMVLISGCTQPAAPPEEPEAAPVITPPETEPVTPPPEVPPETEPTTEPPATGPLTGEGVVIYTDKTAYDSGETVSVTIVNNVGGPVYRLFGCVDEYNLHVLEEGEFKPRQLAGAYCAGIPELIPLGAGETMSFEWGQNLPFTGDAGIIGRVPGTYKVSFRYFTDDEGNGETRVFSDEFVLT